jgi:hypothetical protein
MSVGQLQVGEVRNYVERGKGYRRIPIVLDEDGMQSSNRRLVCCKPDENSQPTILVSSEFMKLSQNLREAGIWHEVGHVHFEHLWIGTFGDDQIQSGDARIKAIQRGEVVDFERAADEFAINRIGRDRFLAYLRYALETRPAGPRESMNDLGRRELALRIALVEGVK